MFTASPQNATVNLASLVLAANTCDLIITGCRCSGDSGGAMFYAATGLLAGITIEADNICSKFAK
jgi:hypothetical protein